MAAAVYELPSAIASMRGAINDVDSHENLPINLWRGEYGPIVDDLIGAIKSSTLSVNGENDKDDCEINAHNVWRQKMEKAPGAWDVHRRLQVLDFIGVKRQLMYPGLMGLMAAGLYARAEKLDFFRSITGDRRGYASKLCATYNDWCIRSGQISDRLRPVAILLGDSPGELISQAKHLTKRGIRAIWLPTDRPPGGKSPAHPELDPLWSVLTDADAILVSHIGTHEGILQSLAWRDAPAFEGWKAGAEFTLDPWSLSTLHLAAEVFLTTMVLGGVFERHPRLMFGSAELGGHWVGPLASNLDSWDVNKPFQSDTGARPMRMRPSEYIRRNVRVACFDFEPVGKYIDRFGLEEVYCYASDFPHHEGGKDPMGDFVKSLSGKSDDVLRKFFISNGSALLRD